MYKSSTKAQVASRAAPDFSLSVDGAENSEWIMEMSEPQARGSDVVARDG